MKKVFNIFLFLISFNCFSQSIDVSTDKYSVDQLVNNVLLKNPPCNATNNITWSTGTNYNSSNGIGYFENTNPNFPLTSGIILSTGDALNAKGPNISEPSLSDGTDTWAGDQDLDNMLLNYHGIHLTSKNATVLEFDFTPISTKFSFDFLFASEEYGNAQCNISDSFAFLLTNLSTNVTTNLAVVPGTQIPISVATIRDRSYNSTCDDQNAQYFGRFNGGSNADNSATNFNGQTVLLNASSTLIINQKYHLKLVIADLTDFKYDSAIFIESDSFNIGQGTLGENISLNSGKSPCYNSSYILDSGLNPNDYSTFFWSKDGVKILNENGSKLTIRDGGTYAINFKKAGCIAVKNEVKIDYEPLTVTEKPIDLYNCSNNANPNLFDLSLNNDLLKTRINPLPVLDPSVEVTYHTSLSDANSNSNPLPKLYTTSQITETIYARIKVPENDCYIVKDFKLSVVTPALANKPADLVVCSDKKNANFILTSQDKTILNGQSPVIYSVKYYSNQADATAGRNEIQTPEKYDSEDTTIFARVNNKTDLTCFSTTSFNLKVNLKPVISSVANIKTCDQYKLPHLDNGEYFTQISGGGTKLKEGDIINTTKNIYIYKKDPVTGCASDKTFKVTIVKDLLPANFKNCGQYKLPSLELGKYYTLPDGKGNVIAVGSFITTTTKIYAYYKTSDCELKDECTITILPQIQLTDVANIFECNSYTLPPLPAVPPLSKINYYSDKDGPKGIGTKLNVGDFITSSQIIYIYAISADACVSEKSFEIIIGNLTDISQCKPYELPKLAVGNYYSQPKGQGEIIPSGTIIKKTQEIYFYVPSSACTDNFKFIVDIGQPEVDELEPVTLCGPFTLPTLTNGEYFTKANGTGTKLNAGDKIYKTQTIFIYKNSVNKKCPNDWPFIITVNQIPEIDARGPVDSCDDYELSPLKNGKYYNGSHQNGGTPELIDPAIKIADSQTIYIYAESPYCSDEGSFEIRIHKPKVDQPDDVISCVTYTLPPLKIGDYFTKPDGPNAVSGNTKLLAGDLIKTSTILYVYADSNTRNNCYNEKNFSITIVPEPIANDVPLIQSTYCDEDGINDGITNIDLTQLNTTIMGNQTSSEFKVEYFASQSDAVLGINGFTTSNLKTVFAKITNTLTLNKCFDITSAINIIVNKIPEPKPIGGVICYDNNTDTLLKSFTINSGLSNNDFDFEWQNELGEIVGIDNTFVATMEGLYTVMAKNKTTGCSSAKIPATVIASEIAIATYTTPDEFTNNPSLTVLTNGFGDYEYQLDNGPFQNNAVFYDVSSGTHIITVRDKNGCGTATIEATIINYPKFFTPNNDGYNDTWNISDVKDLKNIKIQIYDQYGKFLNQILPNEHGWDGQYNGKKLPSTDYWFVITYEKDGVQKIFKSHFSLKR